jgi:hypothetical protein
MIFWRAFCLSRARRSLNAADRWLQPGGGVTMQRFCEWRVDRLINAADRWLRRSEQARTVVHP